jgi:hypothetical protein
MENPIRPLAEQRELRLSLEAEYLTKRPETACDIYYKLAELVVNQANSAATIDDIPGIVTHGDLEAMQTVSKGYLAGRIGNRTSTNDFAAGSTEELERLHRILSGFMNQDD